MYNYRYPVVGMVLYVYGTWSKDCKFIDAYSSFDVATTKEYLITSTINFNVFSKLSQKH